MIPDWRYTMALLWTCTMPWFMGAAHAGPADSTPSGASGTPPTAVAQPQAAPAPPTEAEADPKDEMPTPEAGSSAEPVSEKETPDQSLSRFRTTFEALTDATIGRTSRRVRFDWRRSSVHYGLAGLFPIELNNFGSQGAGMLVRFPSDTSIFEMGLAYQWVGGSKSTERLALTPYRQAGRPDRFELDFGLAYPIAEGIVTAFPAWMPATELVLNARAHFRYVVYPQAFADLDFQDTIKAMVSGTLSRKEISNLEDDRLPAMEIDPARYGLLVGLGDDLYFQSGFFLGHRILVNLPVLGAINESKLGFWFEFALTMGWAL